MKAAVYEKYGSPDVVHIADIERPEITPDQILVQVYTSSVTSPDWRFRASAFPGGLMWLVGRLMFGVFAPRNRVLGNEFAGRVVSVGSNVTKFRMGDPVFGFNMGGGHAEYLAIDANKAVVKKPEGLSYEQATGLPFGGGTALVFLRDFAKLQPGQKVLIGGASGGVGTFAVQLAKHFGADVTAITSTKNVDLVKSLGADHVIDYKREDFTDLGEQFDLVFDTAATMTVKQAKSVLKPGGNFMPLEGNGALALQSLITNPFSNKKILFRVSGDSAEDLKTLGDLAASDKIKVVIDTVYPLDKIVEAHRKVETRHKTGSVIIAVAEQEKKLAAA